MKRLFRGDSSEQGPAPPVTQPITNDLTAKAAADDVPKRSDGPTTAGGNSKPPLGADPPGAPPDYPTWYRRFWADDGPGDSSEKVQAIEDKLEVQLPRHLRDALAHTNLRYADQLHLRGLDSLELDGEILVFADEQQACWSWGIKVEDLAQPDPPLWTNPSGTWQPDKNTLLRFLRFFCVINRCFHPPHVAQMTEAPDKKLLQTSWTAVSLNTEIVNEGPSMADALGLEMPETEYEDWTVWVREGAALVYCLDDAVMLGAKTGEHLAAAATQLDLDLDLEDEDLLRDAESMLPASYDERMEEFKQWTVDKERPDAVLAAIIGDDPLSPADAESAMMDYARREGLLQAKGQKRTVLIDDRLRSIVGDEQQVTLQRLFEACRQHLEQSRSGDNDVE